MTELEFKRKLEKLVDIMIRNEFPVNFKGIDYLITAINDNTLTLVADGGKTMYPKLFVHNDAQKFIFFENYVIQDRDLRLEYKKYKYLYDNCPKTLPEKFDRGDFIAFMKTLHDNPREGSGGEYDELTMVTYADAINNVIHTGVSFKNLIKNIDHYIWLYLYGHKKPVNDSNHNIYSASLAMFKRYCRFKGYDKLV